MYYPNITTISNNNSIIKNSNFNNYQEKNEQLKLI